MESYDHEYTYLFNQLHKAFEGGFINSNEKKYLKVLIMTYNAKLLHLLKNGKYYSKMDLYYLFKELAQENLNTSKKEHIKMLQNESDKGGVSTDVDHSPVGTSLFDIKKLRKDKLMREKQENYELNVKYEKDANFEVNNKHNACILLIDVKSDDM